MPIWPKSCSRSVSKALGALLALLAVLCVVSLGLGASGAGLLEAFTDVLRGRTETSAARILLYIRLPRVACALLAGAALSASGVLIQAVLDNPLAGPNVIGVNAGAGFSTLLLACLFPTAFQLMPAAAFLGALVASLAVFTLADRMGASRMTVVLSGVALSSILSAGIDTLTTLFPESTLGMSGFMIGGFAGATPARIWSAAIYILPALALALLLSRALDVLQLGDEVAASLGMRVRRMRFLLLALSSLLAGAAVSFSGLLGFVGLIVPHAVRRFTGGEHRALMPLSIVCGAIFVLVCDTASRTLFQPYELPVGILMSFIGGPFFLMLLLRQKRGRLHD